MRKTSIYFLTFLLLFTVNPVPLLSVSAEHSDEKDVDEEEVILLSEEVGENILLFESMEDIDEEDKAEKIPDESEAVLLLDTEAEKVDEVEYFFIRYIDEKESGEENQVIEGYVESEVIVSLDVADEVKKERDEINQDSDEAEESEQDNSDDVIKEKEDENKDKEDKELETNSESDESSSESDLEKEIKNEDDNDSNKSQEEKDTTTLSMAVNQTSQKGIALKNKTHVYAKQSLSSKTLKSYTQGSILKLKNSVGNWFEVKVNVNGNYQAGYIHKSHIEEVIASNKGKTLRGIALKNSTNVYSKASTNSKTLKGYKQGKMLKYETFSDNWYTARVNVGGSYKVGYIHKNHVEVPIPSKERVKKYGASLKTATSVYSSPTTSSKALKNYREGKILKYETYSSDWYIANVKVNGVYKSGYIHKNHVGTPKNQATLNGIVSKQTANVYQQPTKSSKVLKSYSNAKVLKYKSYANDWYEAKVKVNGKYQVGYIPASEVEDITQKQITTKGNAKKSPTKVFNKTSKNSKVLKSYKKGKVLKFKTYTDSWYEARVKVNGKYHTGYIHKSDISSNNGKLVFIDAGHGGSDPGASGNGLKEKNLTLDIAKKLQKALEKSGYLVMMSRTTDKYVSLKDRTEKANKANADIFVSVHINSFNGTAHGIETWKMDKGHEPKKSNILAEEIQDATIKETKVNDRGVKDGNLHVNRESLMPSALVELGFIDNKNDSDKLKTEAFKKKAVKGIVNGIKSFFNLVH